MSFYHIVERENFSQIWWTRGNASKTFSDNPDLRIHTRKVKVFNFETIAASSDLRIHVWQVLNFGIIGISSGQWNLCLSC